MFIMTRHKKIIVAVIVLLYSNFFNGCKYKNNEVVNDTDQVVIKNFEDRYFNLDSMIDSVHYVPLETLDECLLGSVDQIRILNDTIYLGDFDNTKSIFVFSMSGKFLFKISKYGKGSDEYVYMNDFDIVDNKILIYDEKSYKFLFYNKDGSFSSYKRVNGFLGVSFNKIQENRLAFFRSDIYSKVDDAHELLITDNSGNIVERHFVFKPWIKPLGLRSFHFYAYGEDDYFCPTFGNTVYKFKGTEPMPYLTVDFGELNLTKDAVVKGAKDAYGFFRGEDYAVLNNFITTGKFLFLMFSYKGSGYNALLEYPDKLRNVGSGFMSTHDTDYLPLVPKCSYNETFVAFIEAHSIKNMVNAHLKTGKLQNTNIYKQLGGKIFQMEEVNNPILVFYTLKKLPNRKK
jgi:hypothetical protein